MIDYFEISKVRAEEKLDQAIRKQGYDSGFWHGVCLGLLIAVISLFCGFLSTLLHRY